MQVRSVWHDLLIVMSPDCDLTWDFEMRFINYLDEKEDEQQIPTESHPLAMTHILLCDLYGHDELRQRFTGKREIWRRVQQNQDERYHHFGSAPVDGGDGFFLHDLYLDFKKSFAVPTAFVYEGLLGDTIGRVAVVPPIQIHDLIHRFYGFLSRVALPE